MTNLLPRKPHALSAILVAESGLNELFTVLDEQIPDSLFPNRGDLDEFGEAVSDL